MLMPMDEWGRISSQVSALPLADQPAALLRRALFSAAEDLTQDKQGRILISQRLRDFARIDAEVVVAGMNTHIELWAPDRWQQQVLSQLEGDSLNTEMFAALGV